MSFIINSGLGSQVTYPQFPRDLTYEAAADVKGFSNPGARYLIICKGKKADVLITEGKFIGAKNTLMAGVITDLDALVATEVTVTNANRPYSGEDFIFVKFKYNERGGMVRGIPYRAEYWRGDIQVVIT